MQVLRQEDLSIKAFAGVLERIYIMDARQFGHHKEPDSLEGMGNLVYLAHAHFTPHGSTGLHGHENINIVTIVTHGAILHQGTLGDRTELRKGQALVQFAGKKGFKHDEGNPLAERSSFIQIWMQPEMVAEEAEHRVLDLDQKRNLIYADAQTRLEVVHLKEGEQYQCEEPYYAFIYEGSVEVEGSRIEAASLVSLNHQALIAKSESYVLVASRASATDERLSHRRAPQPPSRI